MFHPQFKTEQKKTIKVVKFSYSPTKWEIHDTGWISSLGKWLLRKAGALQECFETIETKELVNLDSKKLQHCIIEGVRAVEAAGFKPLRIVLGRDKFYELTSNQYIDTRLDWNIDVRVVINRKPMIFGLQCVMMPLMEGWYIEHE
jgi:hypothetical protein